MDCGGVGCSECRFGLLEIDRCPLELVTSDVFEVIEYALLYEKGLPPVAGGALDQAYNFLVACRLIFADKAYWVRKYKLENQLFG